MPSPPDGARSPQVRRASSGTTSTRPSSIIAAQPGRHATFGRRSIIRFSDTDEDDYTDTFQKEQAPEQTENKLRLKDRLSSPVYVSDWTCLSLSPSALASADSGSSV